MPDARLKRYTEFFEQLTPDGLDRLSSVMSDDIHFVDPFNDVSGLPQVETIFRDMFSLLQEPKFRVTHAAMTGGRTPRGLIRWEMSSTLRGRSFEIVGMSEIGFAPDGRVSEHIDHWDAGRQFYEQLPVLGWILRTIRRQMAV